MLKGHHVQWTEIAVMLINTKDPGSLHTTKPSWATLIQPNMAKFGLDQNQRKSYLYLTARKMDHGILT